MYASPLGYGCMQNQATAPTAQGSFAKTPLPHLLVYALEQRLSGTIELHVAEASVATILFVQGMPSKVRTTEEIHWLGEVMVEMQLVTPEQLTASLDALQTSPKLQGQALLELGVAPDALDLGLRAQLERKIEHLFTLPGDTEFAYFDGVDALARYGGPPTPIDPLPVLWRGIREAPAWEHVDATLRRVGGLGVRVHPQCPVDRFQFLKNELGAVDLMRQKPVRVVEIAGSKIVSPSVAQLLVYCLVITKQVELVDVAAARSPGTPGFAGPVSQAQPSLSGQAFARVQLQKAAAAQARPQIVEEVAHRPGDGRIASPLPSATGGVPAMAPPAPSVPPPAIQESVRPAMGSGSDLSALIHESLPPTAIDEVDPSVPPPAAVPTISEPAPAPAPAELTAEQNALKTKIIERAMTISSQDYFQMLGIGRDASSEQIQKAFIALAKVWHPDRLPGALFDVKDACSKVFTYITEAHAVLNDPAKRKDYMTLLKDGGATPDDQAKIQAVLEAATEFQKAEFMLKRNDVAQAYDHASKARALDPEQHDYLAMCTWIEAQRPEWIGREKTLEKIAVLDRCIKANPASAKIYFWRAMLYKRIEEAKKAVADFRKVSDLDPRNLDAVREVRLYNMRGGSIAPPGQKNPGGGKPSARPQKKEEGLGGLFGKLFKK